MNVPKLSSPFVSLVNSMGELSALNEEDEWQKQDHILQSILDCTTSVIYIKDIAGKYLFVNRQFEELFHISKNLVIGKTDYDLFPEDIAEKFRKNDQEVQQQRKQIEFSETVIHDEEVHLYNSVKFPLVTQDEKYLQCVVYLLISLSAKRLKMRYMRRI